MVNKGNEKENLHFLIYLVQDFLAIDILGEVYKMGTQGYWEKCIHCGIKKGSKTIRVKERKSQEGELLIYDYGIVFKTQGKAKSAKVQVAVLAIK